LVLVPGDTEVFLAVGVVAILFLFGADAPVEVVASPGLVGDASGVGVGVWHITQLLLAVGKGAS
jgi:hypothetical protein